MATQARQSAAPQSRWVRPLVPILAVLVASIVFLFIGSAISNLRSAGSASLDVSKAIPYLLIGAVLAYGISVTVGESDLWRIGTREVVYMAIGAALYGGLSAATNLIQLPSVSLVSLRPAIVIPIFFGVVFGPAVGFFTGFVGNVLGDALTGWGVFPLWDLGNGLIGLVAGLSIGFRSNRQSANALTAIVVLVNLAVIAGLRLYPDTSNQLGSGAVGDFWWVLLVVIALVIGVRVLFRGREDVLAAQLWGAVGIIVGIGFAAIADIWWNGYTPQVALLGEFVPAAGPNLINGLVLLPLLLAAWNSARAQSGR